MSQYHYHSTRFLTSVSEPKQLPLDTGREVAFAGRSNAGKSSALNALTGQRQLARISKTPGRTQMLNYFEITPNHHLVDLPGYGYAKVPEAIRRRWQQALEHYLRQRQSLVGLIVLVDIRRQLTALDRQLLDWSAWRPLPVHLLLTKADKLNRGPATASLHSVRRELEKLYPLASVQLFSATSGQGIDDLRQQLDQWLLPAGIADSHGE